MVNVAREAFRLLSDIWSCSKAFRIGPKVQMSDTTDNLMTTGSDKSTALHVQDDACFGQISMHA